MKTSLLLTALFATTMLVGCTAVQSTSGGTKAEEVGGEWFGINKPDALEITNADAFKGQSKVVIAGFSVTFLEEKRASNKAGGGLLGSGFGGKASAKMTLTGVSATEMQAITEQAYSDFVAKLQKDGYTLADRNGLISSDAFDGASFEKSPKRSESSWLGSDVTQTVVAPTAMGGRIYDGGPMGGFGFSNPMVAANNYAAEHKVPVVFVNYIIDFANKTGGHGSSWSQSASVEVGQGISVAPGSTLHWYGGTTGTFNNQNASVAVGQPISSADTFGEVIGTTSETEAGLETAVNVLTSLGGLGSNQSRSFEVKADPAKYTTVSTKVLGEANSAVVTALKQAR